VRLAARQFRRTKAATVPVIPSCKSDSIAYIADLKFPASPSADFSWNRQI
jgi:hypothetical protein